MPVLLEILSADGRFLKEAEPAVPYDSKYIKSYYLGNLSRIIGAECLATELGGIIHLVQDPDTILAIENGEAEVAEVLTEKTVFLPIYPDVDPIRIPFTTKTGAMGNLAVWHAFTETPTVYN